MTLGGDSSNFSEDFDCVSVPKHCLFSFANHVFHYVIFVDGIF